jgi:hypothetical protein
MLALPGAGRRPPEHYRLTLVAQRHRANAVEVHFGIEQKMSAGLTSPGAAHVLRIDSAGAALGSKQSLASSFYILATTRLQDTAADASHVIHLERQRENWWVFVDERLVGVAPLAQRETPFFRLLAERGQARFSDIALEELVEKKP